MSAAPRAIAKNATIVDQPGKEGGEMPVLRKGMNDWTCMPDDPSTPANDPMCLDKNAVDWAKAWKSHTEPKLSGAGMGYMLQGGGSASNTIRSQRNRRKARNGCKNRRILCFLA